ncbi:hypothetical protein like AT5G27870 [Hibiscus trionum]|uniref:Pectinesterase inhibitor domain-containing protein n=1 Tax=Hibiscus trionum TaxID=183268 RepID=A0A9W7LGT5_HIBTR|nr:hypothetical protein like AT5G27870 [Hibiscus trionum]
MGKAPAIIGVCSVILVAMVVVVAVSVTRSRSGRNDNGGQLAASKKAVQTIFQPTDYKEACEHRIEGSDTTNSKELIKAGFQAAIREIEKVVKNSGTTQDFSKDLMSHQDVNDCKEMMGYAITTS